MFSVDFLNVWFITLFNNLHNGQVQVVLKCDVIKPRVEFYLMYIVFVFLSVFCVVFVSAFVLPIRCTFHGGSNRAH